MESQFLQNVYFFVVCAVLCFVGIQWLVLKVRAKKARQEWPKCEATIESSSTEIVESSHGISISLPVFAFSYEISGERYGGRFALQPYITDPGETILTGLIGRKINVIYDPQSPQTWIIPDDMIEGCKVEQASDPRFGLDLSPKD